MTEIVQAKIFGSRRGFRDEQFTMPQTVEYDLKQAVCQNDAFGPREVRQMQDAIGRDFSQYAMLRDAAGELQAREE